MDNILEKIPIFTGKKAGYNRLILETLLEAENLTLTEWELAKHIQAKTKTQGDWYSQAQRIYSLLIRKKGRLEELNNKGYIDWKRNKVELTFKGMLAAVLSNPELEERAIKMWEHAVKSGMGMLPVFVSKVARTQRTRLPLVGININGKRMKRLFLAFAKGLAANAKVEFKAMIEHIKKLIRNGLNLDEISEFDLLNMVTFNRVVAARESFVRNLERAIDEALEESSKTINKRNANAKKLSSKN